LALALNYRGGLAMLEGRDQDAADSFLENIRFGYAIRRDGLMVNSLVGIAITGVGASGMFDHRDRMTAEQCAAILAILSELEQQAETDEDVLHRERIWMHHAYGWTGHLIQIIEDLSHEEIWLSTNVFISLQSRSSNDAVAAVGIGSASVACDA